MAKVIIVKERLEEQFPFLGRSFEESSSKTEHLEKMFGTKHDMGILGDGKSDWSIHIKNKDHCLSVPNCGIFFLEMETEDVSCWINPSEK